jgi:hypothetical protein
VIHADATFAHHLLEIPVADAVAAVLSLIQKPRPASLAPGVRTVLAVESIRSLNGSVTFEAEIRYFPSSAAD